MAPPRRCPLLLACWCRDHGEYLHQRPENRIPWLRRVGDTSSLKMMGFLRLAEVAWPEGICLVGLLPGAWGSHVQAGWPCGGSPPEPGLGAHSALCS